MSDSNVIELDSARQRVQAAKADRQHDDKRMHPRLQSNDRLFAQVVLSAERPELVGRTLSCRAINLSVGGIQFRTDQPVPPGSLLDLWVDVANRPGKFFLSGEVRWSRPTKGDDNVEHFIGVQLKSGAATDFLDWREFHAEASAR